MGEDFLRVFESLESGRSREKSARALADDLADAVEAWWFHVCAEPLVCEHVEPMADALAAYRATGEKP